MEKFLKRVPFFSDPTRGGIVAEYGEDDSDPEEELNDKFTDLSIMACLLCKRQFPNKEALERHQKLSDLHKVINEGVVNSSVYSVLKIYLTGFCICVLWCAVSLSRVQPFLSYHVTLFPILLEDECYVTREQKRLHTSSSSSSSSSFDHWSGRDIEGDILPNTVIRHSRGERLWLNNQTLLPNIEWPNKSFNLALVSITEQLITLIFFLSFLLIPCLN